MLQKLQNHIINNFPFLKDKKLMIAISGGIDSVILTHLLHRLDYSITLAHCNFNLRETESDLDEVFVQNLGKQLNIEVITTKFNTASYAKKNKQSTQIAARNLRYEWFQSISKELQLDYILTAHHLDDNLETFLINLTRGTGLEGLTGIPSINKNIIRPLLIFSSDEISTFAKDNGIDWREDASNSSTKYTRNKIRHQIIPILKQINPSLLESFNKTTNYLQGSQKIVKDKIDEISKEVLTNDDITIKINIEKLTAINDPRPYLFELLKKYGFTEWNDVYHLLTAQSGKYIATKSYRLLKDREFLLLLPIRKRLLVSNKIFKIEKNTSKITIPINLQFENVNKTSLLSNNIVYVDKILLNYPLVLRKKKTGDIFYPTGMNGKKKISKFFKDEKLSLIDKENTWLLCSSKNEIIWIIGQRLDRRFSISNKTKEILKISI